MGEGDMPIAYVVEELNLFFLEQETSSDRMNGSVAPSLVEETAVLIQLLEEVDIRFRSEPIEVSDFEVGPLKPCVSFYSQYLVIKNVQNGNGCNSLLRHRSTMP